MTGFDRAGSMKRTKVITHSKDAKKPSLAVLKYRKAHSGVSIFENKSGPHHVGYKSMSLGASQAKNFLVNNTRLSSSKNAKFIKSASSPDFRRHVRHGSKQRVSRKQKSSMMEPKDILPAVLPTSLKENLDMKSRNLFQLEVQNAMSLARKSMRDQKRRRKKTQDQFKRPSNTYNIDKTKKAVKQLKSVSPDEANIFFVSRKKVDPNEEAKKRKLQIEYERNQMIDRIKNLSAKTAKEYKKRQHRRNRSEAKNDSNEHRLSKSMVEKPKKTYNNVTKAIAPRFGRAREKSIRKKKNDGLKSHVKIQKPITLEDAGNNGDPYEAQRCQLCLAIPKASAGYKLVWMW